MSMQSAPTTPPGGPGSEPGPRPGPQTLPPGRPMGMLPRLLGAALVVVLLVAQEQRILGEFEPPARVPLRDSAAVPLLVAGLSLLLPARLGWILLGAAGALLSVLLTCDMGAMRYFRQPVGIEMLPALPQMLDVSESASTLATPLEWAYTGIFVLVGLLGWMVARRRAGPPRRRGPLLLVALALLAAGATPLGPTLSLQRQPRSIFDNENPGTRFARAHGLGTYHLWDVVDTTRRRLSRARPDPERMELIGAVFARKKALNDTPSPFHGLAAGRHVILVQLEAIQQFALDHVGPDGPVMPFLRGLADTHLGFDHCMDTTRLGRTSDGEFVVLTGLLPHPRAAVSLTYPRNDWIALPKLLAEDGYATLSLHAFRPDFWNRVVTHPAYGFRTMRFRDSFSGGRNLAWGLADEAFYPQAVEMLAAVDGPFLALVISLSSHHPFNVVPDELSDWDTGLPAGSMAEGYLRLCRYADDTLRTLFAELDARGLLEQSLIVIYGDHDAGLDSESRQAVAAVTGRDLDHPREDRVPLVFVVPGEEAFLAEHRDEAVGTVGGLHEVAPTVLHLLGREIPAGMFGTHLFVPPAARDVLPLHRGGFVAEGRVHSPLDSRAGQTEEEIARIDEWARASWAAEQLAASIIEYDAQRKAPVPDGAAVDADALLARAQRGERPETIPPWADERDGLAGLVADPAGVAAGRTRRTALVGIPAARMGFALELQLANGGAGPGPYRVESRGLDGAALAVVEGVVAPGSTDVVAIPVDPPGADALVAYAVVDHAEGLAPSASLKHAFGPDPRPVATHAAARTRIAGPKGPIGRVHVLLANPSDAPARTTARLSLDGAEVRARPFDLPPRAMGHVMLPLRAPTAPLDVSPDTMVELVVEGDPVVVAFVRYDAEDVPFR